MLLIQEQHLSSLSFATLHKDLGAPRLQHASSNGTDIHFSVYNAAGALFHLGAVPQFPESSFCC